MSNKLPTEFAINMNLEKMMILQQSELSQVSEQDYFDENSPCHIYFICKRLRIIIDPQYFKATDSLLFLKFKIQRQDKCDVLELQVRNGLGTSDVKLFSEYPYSTFKIIHGESILMFAKAAVLLQTAYSYLKNPDYLDLDILYLLSLTLGALIAIKRLLL